MPNRARKSIIIALTCVMAVLLCLVQTVSAVAAKSPGKTASGNFFDAPGFCTGEIASESLQPQWEIAPVTTATASGRQVWLSADPIGEAGGINLYGYVGGNPINFWDIFGLTGYPSTFVGPLRSGDYYIPDGPPGVDIGANCKAAKAMVNPWTFKDKVKYGGAWDYKTLDPKYEDYGNYHYGATGNAFGFSANTLLQEAGRAQIEKGRSNPAWGKPASRCDMLMGKSGTGSNGDEPKDQEWINRGFEWYQGQRPPVPPVPYIIPTGY